MVVKPYLKYLEVLIDDQLRFKEHIEYTYKIAKWKMVNFCQLGNTIRGYSSKMLSSILKCVILPAFAYCSSVWIHALLVRGCKYLLA